MAATTNNFETQSLIAKTAFYEFKRRGYFSRNITWKSQDFGATNRTGASHRYYRPAKVDIKSSALDFNADVTAYPTYSGMVDPMFTLTITKKFSVDVAQGIDYATLVASPEQIKTRYLAEAAAELRRQIDAYGVQCVLNSVGNVIGNPASASTGTTLLDNHALAQSLLNNRGRSIDDDSVMLCSENSAAALMSANIRGMFYEKEVEKLYKTGLMGTYASFDYYRTPILPSVGISGNTAAGITVNTTNVTADNNSGAGIKAGFADSFIVYLNASTPGNIKAGTRVTIEGVNWIQPSTRSEISSGVSSGLATFVVAADAALIATGNGVAVTLKEAAIYNGPYKNVNGTVASVSNGVTTYNSPIANGADVTIISSANATPYSLAFDRGAIFGASPRIDIAGMNLDYAEQTNVDGIDLTFVIDHTPGNRTRVMSLEAMIGYGVYLPDLVSLVF